MAKLPQISSDFSGWYNQVVMDAKLADYGPVKGTMIFRPYGYGLWKNVQKYLGQMINDDEVDDVYFPMFIPQSFLSKEKDHVKGFAPEVAVVTHAGGEQLEEPLIVRPTSETIMYMTFANWIQSYRDLPLKINQWANIVRWEKRTTLFLRTSEFLWQEGHCAFATNEEATEDMFKALDRYEDFLKTYLAVPGYKGYKTSGEKFAGADVTTTIEVLLKSNKALQICTSHNLGQNFAKPFGVKFLDKDNNEQYAWQTSWGFSTRSLGGMIGVHGDDKGLVLPPFIAPIQVVIIPIYKLAEGPGQIKEFVDGIEKMLASVGIRYKTDWTENSPGWKFNEWELKGVPLRIEIGAKEAAAGEIKIVTRVDGTSKTFQKTGTVHTQIEDLLKEITAKMYQNALKRMHENTVTVNSIEELEEALKNDAGFIKFFFKDYITAAKQLQEKYKITPRVIPLETENEVGKDIITGEDGRLTVFAKAY